MSFTQEFVEIFLSGFKRNFPFCAKSLSPHSHINLPWLTPSFIRCCKRKSTLFKVYKKTRSTTNKSRYVAYCNKLKSALTAAVRIYYTAQFALTSASMKSTWRIINKIINLSPRSSLPASFSTCAGDVSDFLTNAKGFNYYFSNVGSTLSNRIGKTDVSIFDSLPQRCAHSAFFESTDHEEVLGIIKTFKNTMSVGVDDILTSIIKLCSDIFSFPLASLFNNF